MFELISLRQTVTTGLYGLWQGQQVEVPQNDTSDQAPVTDSDNDQLFFTLCCVLALYSVPNAPVGFLGRIVSVCVLEEHRSACHLVGPLPCSYTGCTHIDSPAVTAEADRSS